MSAQTATELVDAEGTVVAVRYDGGAWVDPFGGVFSERDIADMTALAAGQIDAFAFGCPGMRVVHREVKPRDRARREEVES